MSKKNCNYDAQSLEMAINAVKNAGSTLHQASKMYSVPYSTLQWRAKNDKEGLYKRGRQPALSKQKEHTMVAAILALKDAGFGLSRREILNLAAESDKMSEPEQRVFSEEGPSGSWFRRFKKRHDLSLRSAENKSAVRNNADEDFDIHRDLFEKYKNIVAENDFDGRQIFNMDEKGFQLVTTGRKICAKKGDKNVYVRVSGERSETITGVACGNAAGTVLIPPFFIFKGESLPSNMDGLSYPEMTTFALSDSGYMNSKLFLQWFKLFLNNVPAIRPILLMLDGHKSHTTLEVLKLAQDNDIIILCLPPHTTHVYQPTDVGVFRSLKLNFADVASKRMRRNKTKVLARKDFAKVVTAAWEMSVTPMNVKGGFKKSGLWPVDEHKRKEFYMEMKNEAENETKLSSVSNTSPSSSSGSSSVLSTLPSSSSGSSSVSSTSPSSNSSSSPEAIVVTSTSLTSDPDVTAVIKEMLKPSPKKQVEVTIKKQIKFATCITEKEYVDAVQLARDEVVEAERKKKERLQEKERKLVEKQKKAEEKQKNAAEKRRVAAEKEKNAAEKRRKAAERKEKAAKEVLKRKQTSNGKHVAKKRKVAEIPTNDSSDSDESNEEQEPRAPLAVRRKLSFRGTDCERKPPGLSGKKFLALNNHIKILWTEPMVPKEVQKGDWLLVRFPVQSRRKNSPTSMVYIGHIIGFSKGKIFGSFLKSIFTKSFTGYVYCYPATKDRALFDFSQIISSLKKPKRYNRGQFLFNIHANKVLSL